MSPVALVLSALISGAAVGLSSPRETRLPHGTRRRRSQRVLGVGSVGRLVLRWGPLRTWLGDDAGESFLGSVLVGSLVMLTIVGPLGLLVPLAAVVVIVRRRRARLKASVARVEKGLPEVIDLLALGVGAGLTLRHALGHAAAWFPTPFGEVFSECVERSDDGEQLVESLRWCQTRLGEPCRPLLRVLMAAESDGAELLPALARAGDEARRRRRINAQERARKVPITMLFPLVLFVLPAFALLTIVPLLLGTLSDLQLPG